LLLIPLVLACFALSPRAQAVVPAPDGGYPGANTAEGTQALNALTSGVWNTALGYRALFSDTTGSSNTATGLQALYHNVNGVNNTATGVLSLFNNTSGFNNTAIGWGSAQGNTTGISNTAIGVNALRNNNADRQTAVGHDALAGNTTGTGNAAVGFRALRANSSGDRCAAFGSEALPLATGDFNTALGETALFQLTTGGLNTAVGVAAGFLLGSGSNNIYLGNFGVGNESGTMRLGIPGNTARAFIFGVRGVTTGIANAVPVLIDGAGQLGTTNSSRRFKNEIKPMDKASEAILALKPATFHYKTDSTGTPQFGLIAEEVAEVNPDLVVRDADGELLTVRYDAVNAMLLNEFLKEHRKVEEQQAAITELRSTVAQQQKGMEVLTAQLKEQAAQIQKVSAQLEASQPAPKVVVNTP
jgi:hypothetical protein